jgi:hypothetical protein
MNVSLAQGLPFALLQPGMPLRIEVRGAIYFGPVNQWTCHTVFPRIELGLKICRILDGYWGKDEHGRVRRLAPLGGRELVFGHTPLDVFIDLHQMKFVEVRELHQMLVGFRLTPIQQALP